eukprot:6175783-Pleurochrysis_carterae.AAC.3
MHADVMGDDRFYEARSTSQAGASHLQHVTHAHHSEAATPRASASCFQTCGIRIRPVARAPGAAPAASPSACSPARRGSSPVLGTTAGLAQHGRVRCTHSALVAVSPLLLIILGMRNTI